MSLKIANFQENTQNTRKEFRKIIKDLHLEIITSTLISVNIMDYILCKIFTLQSKQKKICPLKDTLNKVEANT